MDDAQSRMLDLNVKLATKRAAGRTLSRSEHMIVDIMWIDVQVGMNGFDGWLFNTTSARMASTLEALERIGCTAVLKTVRDALRLAGVDSSVTSDAERQARIDALTDADRARLSELDGAFYRGEEDCMAACEAYVESHASDFTV
jgi:hypothetical protein